MSEITKQIVHVVNLLPSFFPNKIHEKAKLEAQLANVEEENICTHNSTVVIRACFSFFHRKAHKIIIFSCFHDVFMIFYFIIFYHTFLISVMVHSFFFNNVKILWFYSIFEKKNTIWTLNNIYYKSISCLNSMSWFNHSNFTLHILSSVSLL